MKEELKRELENYNTQIRSYFNVYKTSSGLYVDEDLCKTYNIGIQHETKMIKENRCRLVNDKDLDAITQATKNDPVMYVPNFVTIFDLQLVLSFNVYVDKNHSCKIYISDGTCTQYNITPLSKRMINGATFCNVTEDDLIKIENQSAKEKVRLKRNYIDIELPDEIKPAEFLFILYNDYETNKKYIRRDTFEQFKIAGIKVEGNPKIIDGKNCYSITENELKDVEEILNYRGIEQLLRPTASIYPLRKTYPSDEEIQTIVDKIYSLKERESLFEQVKPYDDAIVNDDIKPYLDRIKPVLGDDDIIKPFLEKINTKPLIIYRDERADILYIPTEKENASTTIMHKPCREIDFDEIKTINQKTIIASVYVVEKKEYSIIICNNNGQLFISHDALADLGFYMEDPYRIMVNKEIYEEISQQDLDLIKDQESDCCHINIIIKQIAPKRG